MRLIQKKIKDRETMNEMKTENVEEVDDGGQKL